MLIKKSRSVFSTLLCVSLILCGNKLLAQDMEKDAPTTIFTVSKEKPLFVWHTSDSLNDPWTTKDSVKELVFVGLVYVDWKQTRHFTQVEFKDEYEEINPFLGKHPSRRKVNQMCLLSVTGHYVISRLLNEKWRRRWNYVTIGAEATAVGWNFNAGISINMHKH